MINPSSSARLSRRGLLGLGAAALAGTALGCSSSGGGADDPLRLSWYGGAPVTDGLNAAVKAWKDDHDGADVGTESAPFADYWDKLATQVAGKDGPDVFRMSMSYFTEYADRGALLDLTSAVGSVIKTDDLDSDVASSGEIDGKMMGIGQSSISHATFVNPELVETVGGTLPRTWSWDTFADFAAGFAGEAGAGTYGTTDAGGNLQIFEVYSRQHGSEIFGDAGLAVTADVIEEWLAFWQQLRTTKAAPPASLTAEGGSFETSLLTKGKAPVEFGWVQQVTFYQPLMKQTVDVAAVPGKTPGSLDGQFLKALDFWCVAGSTSDDERAEQLVNFLVNDERAAKAIGLTLGVPPSERARKVLSTDPKSAEGRAIGYVDAISAEVGSSPAAWPKGYSELQSTFTRLNQDVGFGKSDPAKAAASFLDEAKQVLSRR